MKNAGRVMVVVIGLLLNGCAAVHVGITANSAVDEARPVLCAPCITTAMPVWTSMMEVGIGFGFDYRIFPWLIFIYVPGGQY